MANHEWEVILALATALQALTLGVIRYLLKLVDIRDARIEKMTEAATATNLLNEQLATLYVAEQKARAKGDTP